MYKTTTIPTGLFDGLKKRKISHPSKPAPSAPILNSAISDLVGYCRPGELKFITWKSAVTVGQLLVVGVLIVYDKTMGLPRVRTTSMHRAAASARTGGVRKITSRFEF